MSLPLLYYELNARLNKIKNIFYIKKLKGPSLRTYGLFFINHEYKLVYIENTKVASRSIINSTNTFQERARHFIQEKNKRKFLTIISVDIFKISRLHLKVYTLFGKTYAETRDWLKPKEISDYTVFSFVRNPFDRAVSGFCNKIALKEQMPFLPKIKNYNSWEEVVGDKITNGPESFKLFVENYLYKNKDIFINKHFASQNFLLFGTGLFNEEFKNKIFIGKLENIKEDWQQLCTKINKNLEHPSLINNSTNKTNYEDYYQDRETVEMVFKRYEEDIIDFGYLDIYYKLLNKVSDTSHLK